jgi:hypothetical protein
MTLRFLEIRTYRVVPGQRDRLHALMTDVAPMLARYGITVVDHGPSVANDEGPQHYYLMRAFRSLAEREDLERAFYGSAEWREQWREDVLACIEDYHTVVVDTGPEVIAGLTRSRQLTGSVDRG